jgi:hypothetical protein
MLKGLAIVAVLLIASSDAGAQSGVSAAEAPGQLSAMTPLLGAWVAEGQGFTSVMTYEWVLPNRLLRVRNVLRNGAGEQFGEYEGHYAWHQGRSTIVFWTVGGNGELHEGTAAWREGRLWHDARVTGGKIEAYRSVLDLGPHELRYRAKYGTPATDASLLASDPLVYLRKG